MTTSNRPNLDALSAALDIYRDAMRDVIVRVLSAAYGGDLAEVVTDALEERGRDDTVRRIEGGSRVEDSIDANDFSAIVGREWALFRQHFSNDTGVTTRMRLVGEARNHVAHPPRSDLAAHDVMARLSDMADLIERVGATPEADAVRALLSEVTVRVAADDEARAARSARERQLASTSEETGRRQQEEAARRKAERQRREERERQVAELRQRIDLESAAQAPDEQLIDLHARVGVLQAELVTLQELYAAADATHESTQEDLAARIAGLQQAHGRTEATIAELYGLIEAGRAGQERIGADVDRLASWDADRGSRIESLEARARAGSGWSRLIRLTVLVIVVAAIAQVVGLVELTQWPPGSGSFFEDGQEDMASAPEPGSSPATSPPAGGTPSTGGQAAPSSASEAATQGGAPLLPGTEPNPATIMNTGADGMGPGGAGVGHYRACILDDHFRVSETTWPDGTAVAVVEIGQDECFGWLLVDIDDERTWVREEYVMTQVGDEADILLFNAANTEVSRPDVVLKLAVFTDTDLNKHWLFVEEYKDRLPSAHLTDSRGSIGTSWPISSRGNNDGLSFARMDDHGRILDIFEVRPGGDHAWRVGDGIAGNAQLRIVTRLGWFVERGIGSGSYVEVFELPMRALPDGTPQ